MLKGEKVGTFWTAAFRLLAPTGFCFVMHIHCPSHGEEQSHACVVRERGVVWMMRKR